MVLILVIAGCEKTAPDTTNQEKAASTNESAQKNQEVNKLKGHESNSHRHGPNGGHIFEFDDSTEFLGEWVQHRSSDLITIFILDDTGKQNLPLAIESMIVRRGDALFSLDPVEPNDVGETAKYALEDKDLTIAMNLGVTVEIDISEKTYSGKIPANAGHHH